MHVNDKCMSTAHFTDKYLVLCTLRNSLLSSCEFSESFDSGSFDFVQGLEIRPFPYEQGVAVKCQTPLHGHRRRTCCTTPSTDELTTILQLVV